MVSQYLERTRWIITEIRKDIKWYEWLYQISNLGRVKRLSWFVKSLSSKWKYFLHKRNERILKWQISKRRWYYNVILCKDWKIKWHRVWRLVAIAFLENIKWKDFINHKDWNKLNNRVDNLERCTRSENELHAYRIWLKITNINPHYWKDNWMFWKKWKDNHLSKKIKCYDKQWNLYKEFDSIRLASIFFWIREQNISNVCCWRRKYTNNFTFVKV